MKVSVTIASILAMSTLTYIVNARLPTEKAHGIQIAHTLDALSSLRCSVLLVIPNRVNEIDDSIQVYYDLNHNIAVTKLFCVDLLPFFKNTLCYFIQTWTFWFSVIYWIVTTKRKGPFYTRNWPLALILSLIGIRSVFVEVHEYPETLIGRWLLKQTIARVTQTISTNPLLTRALYELSDSQIETIPNGAKKSLTTKLSKAQAIRKLGLSVENFKVTYIGSLYDHKGVPTLIDASIKLPKDTSVVVVGGPEDIYETLKKHVSSRHTSLLLAGPVTQEEVAVYLRATDILVIPNSITKSFSSHFTSPIKLFEYFQASRPILASDVPAIRQFAGDKIWYYKPDDANDLVKQIDTLKRNKKLLGRLSKSTSQLASLFTWENRAKQIQHILATGDK